MALFIIILSGFLLISCGSNERVCDKLCIPDSLVTFNQNIELSKTDYKIITHIDLSCNVCWDDLFMWNNFLNDSINNNSSLYCFIYTIDKKITEKKLFNVADLSPRCYIIFDEQSKYLENNKEIIKKYRTVSFVTDSSMNIILYGAPFYDKELREKYLSLFK
ncbi:MAG: hypothetical protein E7071_08665 [Bacteroidales bacterium]|nr:hypothetical protein [Bacteroidales bacterium]